MTAEMVCWTIFDRPLDFPRDVVARRFVVRAGAVEPTDEVAVFGSLELAQRWLAAQPNLTCFGRSPDDEPQIVESWIGSE